MARKAWQRSASKALYGKRLLSMGKHGKASNAQDLLELHRITGHRLAKQSQKGIERHGNARQWQQRDRQSPVPLFFTLTAPWQVVLACQNA